MTISSVVRRNDYVGSGITGPYPFTFRINAATDLVVTAVDLSSNESALAYPGDYTVSGVGEAGGAITLTTALPSGWILIVERVVSLTQDTSIRNQGPYFADTHEDVFDRAVMIDQQQQGLIDRSFKAPVGAGDIDATIIGFEPLNYVRVRADGAGLEGVSTVITSAPVYPIQAGEVGVTSTLFPVGNIQRHGATSNGSAAITSAAIVNALASVPTGANGVLGGVVWVPRGTWNTNQQFVIGGDNVAILGEIGHVIVADVPSANFGVFVASDKNRLVIENLRITGAFPWGIAIIRGSGHRIRRNYVSGGTRPDNTSALLGGIYLAGPLDDFEIGWNRCQGNGIVTGDNGADIQLNSGSTPISNGRIHHNFCLSTLVVGNIFTFNTFKCEITDNDCSGARVFQSAGGGAGGYGIMVYNAYAGSGAGQCQITVNRVKGTQGTGIYANDTPNVVISKNIVDDTGSVQSDVSLPVAGIASSCPGALIEGNIITNSHRSGIAVTLNGAGLPDKVEIRGNDIDTTFIDGISLRGPSNVLVEDNKLKNINTNGGSTAIGTYLQSDIAMTNIVIRKNQIDGITPVGSTVGIYTGPSSVDVTIADNTLRNIADVTRGISNGGTGASQTFNNTINGDRYLDAMSPDRGDNNVTVVVARDYEVQRFASALTANRTVTLSATNAKGGRKFRVVRTGLGAFTLNVGGLKTIPSATAAFVDVQHDGTSWQLAGYGTL